MAMERIDTKQLISQVDIVALAGRYSQLHKESSHEWAGPCPKCGGSDRFHVRQDGQNGWFFCRQCHAKGGDAIDLLRWLQPGMSFQDAVAQLVGGTLPTATARKPERKQAASPASLSEWQPRATVMLQAAQERLLDPAGEAGQDYLISRGLEPRTWLQFGLGYRADVSVPGTEGKQKAPAICIPWVAGGKVVAIRYRFLAAQDGHKQTAEYGSQFAGRLFGGHGLPEWVTFSRPEGGDLLALCDLVICEGEINAMSIWQVAGHTHLHVLSLGSESAKLSDAMIAFAQRYRHVIVWADRPDIAHDLQGKIPAAHSLVSPGGKDANDLLRNREGLLGAVLGMARLKACRTAHDREGLLWDLWDAAQMGMGVDAGTGQVIQRIAQDLGKGIQVAA